MTRAAMQQALDALVYHTEQTRPISKTESAIAALREALERLDGLGQMQEPAGALWELRTPRGKQPFRYYTPEQVCDMLDAEREARQEAQRRVAELQERINQADRDMALAVAKERERFAELMTDLRVLATRCQWPDGDGAQVIAQMWAEEWVRKIDGPNAEIVQQNV